MSGFREKVMNSIDQFLIQIRPRQKTLLDHSVYSLVKDLESLKVFMGSHVFAVWDFMTLLKSLQKQITCVQTPWFPLEDTFSARFVNEIVLAEETDEVRQGCYMSHFDLYLEAMKEVEEEEAAEAREKAGEEGGEPPAEEAAAKPVGEDGKGDTPKEDDQEGEKPNG
ncbi:MAG: DUF3050 domain-containing protein [Proteobacteria bacterium]|nr:DUF3050 domain-containing protein [Pseudomonadota bacterium]